LEREESGRLNYNKIALFEFLLVLKLHVIKSIRQEAQKEVNREASEFVVLDNMPTIDN